MFERLKSAISGAPASIPETIPEAAAEIIDSPSLHDRLNPSAYHQHALPEQQAGYQAGDNHGGDAGAAADLGCWGGPPQSVDLDVAQAGETATGRVIDLQNNSSNEAGAMQQHVAAIVGPHGLKLSARPDWRAIPGGTEDWAREFAATLESEWRGYTSSDANSVDIRRILNWPALSATLTQSAMQHGEILASFEPRRSPLPGEMQTAFRIIDPSRLSDPKDNPTAMRDRDIRQGVEYNSQGEPIAYWIASRHPRDLAPSTGRSAQRSKLKWTRSPKWGRNGRMRIFHALDPTRAEQSRGISPLVASLRAARMLKRTEDATLQAAVLQSVMAVVVRSNASWSDVATALGAQSTDPQSDGVSNFLSAMQKFQAARGSFYAANQPKVSGHNAKVVHMLPDEDLEMKAAAAGNVEIAGFLKEMRAGVASNHGLGLAEYSGDFSKVSFSAAKVSGALSARIQAGRRERLITPTCRWMFGAFVEELLIRRLDLLPREATFYGPERNAILRSVWTGPPVIEPDPSKAAKAADQRLSSGYSSLEREAALIGEDYEELIYQQARELRLKEELGLFELEAKQSAARTSQTALDAGDLDDDDDGELGNSDDDNGSGDNGAQRSTKEGNDA